MAEDMKPKGRPTKPTAKTGRKVFQSGKQRNVFTIIILIGVVFVAVALFIVNTGAPELSESSVAEPERTDSTPGGNQNERYVAAVKDENRDRAEVASQSGDSAIPTMFDGAVRDPITYEIEEPEPEPTEEFVPTGSDPLPRPQPQYQNQQRQQQRELNAPMLAQAQALMESWSGPIESTQATLNTTPPPKPEPENPPANPADQPTPPVDLLYRAGEMVPAVIDTELSTDYPGRVRATIVSGPLRGAFAIGGFAQQMDTVLLSFDQLSIEGKGSVPVEMVAVDPGTGNSGIASEVDRHYLYRYSSLLGGILVRSLGAYGDLTAQENTSQVLDNNGNVIFSRGELDSNDKVIASLGRGADDATRDLGQEIGDGFNRPETVRVLQNEEVNLFVLQDIPKSLVE